MHGVQSVQAWFNQELVSHERAYGLINICRMPTKGGGNCNIRPHIPHKICPSVFNSKCFLSLYSSQMAEKAVRVHFYHHFSSRLLVQKTRCPVQIHNAVPSVHWLSYKDMNLGSVKDLFTAASLLLPVEHDLSRQAVASVASSMSFWTKNPFRRAVHGPWAWVSITDVICAAQQLLLDPSGRRGHFPPHSYIVICTGDFDQA